MGRRTLEKRGRSQDEIVEIGGTAGMPVKAAGNVGDHLLSLQQTHGNRAVTTMVQRKPRERPASTDAPNAKKKKKAVPKAPGIQNLAPTSPNPKFSDWKDSDLTARARQESESTVKNSLYFATELYEEAWFRTKNKADSKTVAMFLVRVYNKLGDAKASAFWELVHTGKFDPRAPVKEDMSDKQF